MQDRRSQSHMTTPTGCGFLNRTKNENLFVSNPGDLSFPRPIPPVFHQIEDDFRNCNGVNLRLGFYNLQKIYLPDIVVEWLTLAFLNFGVPANHPP
jgi:hypothetical protein